VWSAVRAAVPDAELHVFYEVERWIASARWFMDEIGRRANLIRRWLEKPPAGVVFHGMVDPWTLAGEQRMCALWAYPADVVSGTETFCITGLEAAAAGCSMLVAAADCLPEIYGEVAAMAGLPLDVEAFGEAVVKLLTDEEQAARFRPGLTFARKYSWDEVAGQWDAALRRLVEGGDGQDEDAG
jgi:glycosyltransferase involved in cell wall biosynthesis